MSPYEQQEGSFGIQTTAEQLSQLTVDQKPDRLIRLVTELHEKLKNGKAVYCSGLTSNHYVLAPYITKDFWSKVGDEITQREGKYPLMHYTTISKLSRLQSYLMGDRIPGDKWITLRLDGHGFSKFTKLLRRKDVLPARGFSEKFGEIMQYCAKELMLKFQAKYSYTQSDEITCIIPRTALLPEKERKQPDDRQPHEFNGRVQKIASLSASFVTSRFNFKLQQLCDNNDLDEDFLATFDCRVGAFDTFEEAFALILWRSYDCGVNGISDMVHSLKGTKMVTSPNEGTGAIANDYKNLVEKSTIKKLEFLLKYDFLPLPAHQAYGSFFQSVKRKRQGVNPKTGEAAPVKLKKTIVGPLQQNVLTMFANELRGCEVDGRLFLDDDEI